MPRINAHGHRPAFPNITQALDPSARPSAVPTHHQTGASSSATAFEVGVKTINQGFTSLKIHRPNCAESALRAQARQKTQKKIKEKSIPYTSNRATSQVNLNGAATLGGSDSSGKVVCSHLSTAFAQHAGKKSDLMDAFSTKAGITKVFDGKWNQIGQPHEETLSTVPSGCKHLVRSEQLGEYLKAMASQLEAPGRTSSLSQANCLLITSNHAMALHVERKNKNGVAYFSAKLYDPNVTASYRRVVKATPEDFANLTSKDMMIKPDNANLYRVGGSEQVSMLVVSLDERLQPRMNRMGIEPSVENMLLALGHGFPKEVRSMLNAAFSEDCAPDQRLALLKAMSDLGTPGLFAAFNRRHSDVIDVFSEGVLESHKLTLEEKVDLLASTRDGIPGLALAFGHGDTDAIDIFAKRILESEDLPPQAKIDLLSAKVGGEIPVLFTAFSFGNADTIHVFAKRVLECGNLSQEDKVHLLSAQYGDGVPGLAGAFAEGKSDVIDVFAKTVLGSGLTPQAMIGLLSARSNDGWPGLARACEKGHSDAIDAFTKGVLESENLEPQDKLNLLSAKLSDGTPGLALAFHHGKSDAIDAFANSVLESELTSQAMTDLLSAKLSDGMPGLAIAFHQGKSDVIDKFTQRVLGSDKLTLKNKVDLLSAKLLNGVPGLALAHQQNQAHAIDVFVKRIKESSELTPQAKSELLNLTLASKIKTVLTNCLPSCVTPR